MFPIRDENPTLHASVATFAIVGMKARLRHGPLVLLSGCLMASTGIARDKISFTKPADPKKWEQALPLGNGRLGMARGTNRHEERRPPTSLQRTGPTPEIGQTSTRTSFLKGSDIHTAALRCGSPSGSMPFVVHALPPAILAGLRCRSPSAKGNEQELTLPPRLLGRFGAKVL